MSTEVWGRAVAASSNAPSNTPGKEKALVSPWRGDSSHGPHYRSSQRARRRPLKRDSRRSLNHVRDPSQRCRAQTVYGNSVREGHRVHGRQVGQHWTGQLHAPARNRLPKICRRGPGQVGRVAIKEAPVGQGVGGGGRGGSCGGWV